MTNEELYGLMERFERSSLSGLKVKDGDFEVELQRRLTAAPAVSAPVASAPAAPVQEAPAAEEGPVVTAPLVGTFYAAPAPGEAPYVQAGDRVRKGQTLCLMEAMKMMSEIPAPCDCIIEAVLKVDGELAAFKEPLFRYRAV